MSRKTREQLRKAEQALLETIGIAKSLGRTSLEAVDLTKRSIELTRQSMHAADRAADIAERALDLTDILEAEIAKGPSLGVLSPEQLKAAAEKFPMWKVDSGFEGGQARKKYTRSLEDLEPSLINDHDTYLRFADPEYFDWGLLEIFDSYSGTGSWGTFNSFTIYSEIPGPVNISDMIAISAAESYLAEQGLIVPRTEDEFAEAV